MRLSSKLDGASDTVDDTVRASRHESANVGSQSRVIIAGMIAITIASQGCSSATPEADEPQPAGHTSPRPENPIAAYLRDAECQTENDRQRANVRTALEDMATLSPDQLRERRYENFTGQPGQWDLRTLLKRHVVPYPMRELPEHEAFWTATDSDEVRKLADAACR